MAEIEGQVSDEAQRFSALRHHLASLLSGVIGEAQMALMGSAAIDPETRHCLERIEELALSMSEALKASKEKR